MHKCVRGQTGAYVIVPLYLDCVRLYAPSASIVCLPFFVRKHACGASTVFSLVYGRNFCQQAPKAKDIKSVILQQSTTARQLALQLKPTGVAQQLVRQLLMHSATCETWLELPPAEAARHMQKKAAWAESTFRMAKSMVSALNKKTPSKVKKSGAK